MKKLMLCLVVAAFAMASALHAGDAKTSNKTKAASPASAKVSSSDKDKAACSTKSGCCCDKEKSAQTKIVRSPKGADLAKN